MELRQGECSSEGVAPARGGLIAEEACAGKGRERRLGGVILQAGPLLDLSRVYAEEIDREVGVPVVLHFIVFLRELAMEGVLRAQNHEVSEMLRV